MPIHEKPIGSINLMEDVIPLSEFRSTIAECFARTRKTHRPLLITQNGRASSVVLDVADFQRMRETLEMIDDIATAEEEIERGEEITQDEFRKALLTAGTAGNFPSCGAAEQQRQKPWR